MSDAWSLKDKVRNMTHIFKGACYSKRIINTLRIKLLEDIDNIWNSRHVENWSCGDDEMISPNEIKKIINKRFGVD